MVGSGAIMQITTTTRILTINTISSTTSNKPQHTLSIVHYHYNCVNHHPTTHTTTAITTALRVTTVAAITTQPRSSQISLVILSHNLPTSPPPHGATNNTTVQHSCITPLQPAYHGATTSTTIISNSRHSAKKYSLPPIS